VKDRAKQSSSSWYQSARLITVQLEFLLIELLVASSCGSRSSLVFSSGALQLQDQSILFSKVRSNLLQDRSIMFPVRPGHYFKN
jgi:hypothetical protein